MGKNKKIPVFGAKPAPKKKPIIADHEFEDGHPLAWRFSHTDKGGPFAWNIQPLEKFHEVLNKLFEFESKNWNEITAGGSHPIQIERLCDVAKQRLIDIQRDDLDELLSLRLTGPNRVWCERRGHIVRLLWWDENHHVYPTPKDKGDRKKAARRNRS